MDLLRFEMSNPCDSNDANTALNRNQFDSRNGKKKSDELNGSGPYKGVTKQKKGHWRGQGFVDGNTKFLASALTEEECARQTRLKVAELRTSGHRVSKDYGAPITLQAAAIRLVISVFEKVKS